MSNFIINVEAGKTVCDSRCPTFKEEPHCGGGVYRGKTMTIGSTWHDTFHREVVLVNRVEDDILCVLKHSSKRSIFRVPIKLFKTHYKKLKV